MKRRFLAELLDDLFGRDIEIKPGVFLTQNGTFRVDVSQLLERPEFKRQIKALDELFSTMPRKG